MSLSGKLEDVSLADVMQFIHLGRRTGTLSLERDEERAEVNFHRGAIVGAWSPSSKRLGDLLVEKNLLDLDVLNRALETQARERPKRSLGQILLASGAVSVAAVRTAIQRQIERTIYELVSWTYGSFVFELDTLRPVDDIAVYPGDLIPDIDLNTQHVLLEAARIFDEQQRREGEDGGTLVVPPPTQEPRTQVSSRDPADQSEDFRIPMLEDDVEEGARYWTGAEGRALHLVSDDDDLTRRLEELMVREGVKVSLLEKSEALGGRGGDGPQLVAVDVGSDGGGLSRLSEICRRQPGLPVVGIVHRSEDTARVYEEGAYAVVPPDPAAVLGCFHSIVRIRGSQARRPVREKASRSGFAKLRRVVSDLRSGVLSATVALNLMNIIAESVERAVLFLVRQNDMSALGAFGFNQHDKPLAEVTRGLKLGLEAENVLTDAIRGGHALSVPFEDARLPEDFAALVGRPTAGQVVVFPVLGSDRVILVIYCDNGPLDKPIEEIDILDLATAQMGMAFENELLRRQLAGQKV